MSPIEKIAELLYDGLHPDRKKERFICAEIAFREVLKIMRAKNECTDLDIEKVASFLHEKWLERNKQRATVEQRNRYIDMTEYEKEKDRFFVMAALKVINEHPSLLIKKYLLIDGENTRQIITHFLDNKNEFLKFDIYKILGGALPGTNFDKIIWYAAKIISTGSGSTKSKKLIDFQRRLFGMLTKQNVEINLAGRIQKIDNVFREKEVDVSIATDLVSLAYEEPDTEIYLWSSDSDLIPAIKKIRSKKVIVKYIGIDRNVTKSMVFNCSQTFIIVRPTLLKSFENKNIDGR